MPSKLTRQRIQGRACSDQRCTRKSRGDKERHIKWFWGSSGGLNEHFAEFAAVGSEQFRRACLHDEEAFRQSVVETRQVVRLERNVTPISNAIEVRQVAVLLNKGCPENQEPSFGVNGKPVVPVVTTPGEEAQAVVDRLVRAGIRAVLNFAPVQIQVPADVTLKNVNMAMELEGLSFALTNRNR